MIETACAFLAIGLAGIPLAAIITMLTAPPGPPSIVAPVIEPTLPVDWPLNPGEAVRWATPLYPADLMTEQQYEQAVQDCYAWARERYLEILAVDMLTLGHAADAIDDGEDTLDRILAGLHALEPVGAS